MHFIFVLHAFVQTFPALYQSMQCDCNSTKWPLSDKQPHTDIIWWSSHSLRPDVPPGVLVSYFGTGIMQFSRSPYPSFACNSLMMYLFFLPFAFSPRIYSYFPIFFNFFSFLWPLPPFFPITIQSSESFLLLKTPKVPLVLYIYNSHL